MSATLRQRAEQAIQNLWTLVAPPTIWALHFLFCYVYAAVRCAKGAESLGDVRLAIAVATFVSLSLIAASGYIGWAHAWTPGDPPPHADSTKEDRRRFLGTAKLLLAALSFVAIVFTALPAYVFEDCR